MLNQILSVAAAAISGLSFFGFVFLSRYYEKFGIRLQDLDLPPQHYLIRGLDILLKDIWLLMFVVTIAGLSFLLFRRFRLNFKFFTVDVRVLAGCLIVLMLTISFFETRRFAAVMYKRDVFSETTALRKLTCLQTVSEFAKTWYGNFHDDPTSVAMILHRDAERLVVFTEPKIKKGEPRVELVELGLHRTDVYAHAIGSGGVTSIPASSACFR